MGFSTKVTSAYQDLTGRDFEEHVAGAFELLGYDVEIADAGLRRTLDILAKKDDVRVGILCSNTDTPVDGDEVHETAEGARHLHQCDQVTIVAIGGFTNDAKRRARRDRVQLLDGKSWPEFLHRALRRDQWSDRGVKVPGVDAGARPLARPDQPKTLETWEVREARQRDKGGGLVAMLVLGVVLVGAGLAGLELNRIHPGLLKLPHATHAAMPAYANGTTVEQSNTQMLPARTTAQVHQAAQAAAAARAAAISTPVPTPEPVTTAPPADSSNADAGADKTQSCEQDTDPVVVRQASLDTSNDTSGHGTATVRVSVDSSGGVAGVSLTESSGNRAYDWAAQNAARASTYRPAIASCAPAAGSVDLTF